MIGEGIKRIPAYKCDLPHDQLSEKRDKFWGKTINLPKSFQTRKSVEGPQRMLRFGSAAW